MSEKLEIAGHAWQGTCFSQGGRYGNCECGKFQYCDYSQHQKHLASWQRIRDLAAPAVQPSPASADARKVAAGYFDPNNIRERWAQVYNHTTFHGATKTAELDTATFDAFNHDLPALLESFRAETLARAEEICLGFAGIAEQHALEGQERMAGAALRNAAYTINKLGSDPNWLARQIAAAQLSEMHAMRNTYHHAEEPGRQFEVVRYMDRRVGEIERQIAALSATKLESGEQKVPQCPKCHSRHLRCENGCTWEISR